MRLPFGEAIDDLHARALELVRPADVALFIETGLEFDHRSHGLAVLRGFHECRDHRGLVACAVKRLLDGNDGGVDRGLMQEIDHHLEAFVGVVDDHVLLANGGEDIAVMRQHTLGIAGREGRELEVGARLVADGVEIVEPQHPAGFHDHRRIDIELFAQKRFGGLVAFIVEFEQHRAAPAAALDGGAEIAHQVFGFVFHLDVAVAQHAEDAVAEDLEAGKHLVGEFGHQLFDGDVDGLFAPFALGHAHEARRAAGDEDHLDQLALALAALQAEQHAHPAARDEGERMRGVDGLRGDERQDVGLEIVFEPLLLFFGEFIDQRDDNALLGEKSPQDLETFLLAVFQFEHLLADGFELLARAAAIDAGRFDIALQLPFEAGDAHGGELVEIAARNRQETQAFEQRVIAVLAFGEDAAVEAEPAQFAVDVAFFRSLGRGNHPFRIRLGTGVVGAGGGGFAKGHGRVSRLIAFLR